MTHGDALTAAAISAVLMAVGLAARTIAPRRLERAARLRLSLGWYGLGGSAEHGNGAASARRLIASTTTRVRTIVTSSARSTRDETDHAALLEAVARSLRAGTSLAAAIDEAVTAAAPGAAYEDLARTVVAVGAGTPLAAALESWTGARPGAARRLAGAALTLGVELGGDQARSLDAAAAGLRDRAALRREVRALTSQSRASAVAMVLTPVGFGVLASLADPRVGRIVTATPAGWLCVSAGLVLDLMGLAWMSHLTGRVR